MTQTFPGHPGDYNEIYPEDPYMDEMADEARVWRVYNDEAEMKDTEMIAGMQGNLDTQLIFVRPFLSLCNLS